jgi:hypothetical protein
MFDIRVVCACGSAQLDCAALCPHSEWWGTPSKIQQDWTPTQEFNSLQLFSLIITILVAKSD